MSHQTTNNQDKGQGWSQRSGDHVVTLIPTNATASGNWALVGDGDFDGDGDQDLLWRHRDGANTIWEIENGRYVINHNLPNANEFWRVDAVRDVDHDGDDDIIWTHRNDGGRVIWEIQDNQYVRHFKHNDHDGLG